MARPFAVASILLVDLATAAFMRTPRQDNYTSIFASELSPGASIYYPSDADYDEEIIQRWSTFDEPSYVVAIKPATCEDVKAIVTTANAHNIPFLATGGGHQTGPGFAAVDHAVDIDLSNFNTATLDASANRVTVGPGVIFSDLYDLLYNAGKLIPVGNLPCVNMIGATIGAGVGPYQGLLGLVIDSLRSVKLVTADGRLVTASDSENPDLFWAIRGAGANFGIIVEATYEVYDAPNNGQLIEADFLFNPAANESLWEVVHSLDATFPPEMGLILVGGCNHTSNQATLIGSFSYFGTQEEAQPYLDQLIALNPIIWRNVSVGWNQLGASEGFGNSAPVACRRGVYANAFTVGVKRTDVPTFTREYNNFTDWCLARPWYSGSLFFQRYSAAAALAVPPSEQGVYPWRDIEMQVEFNHAYDGPEHDSEVEAYSVAARAEFQAVSGFDELQAYINYAFGDEGPEVWYGKNNLPRLVSLKKEWDPESKFGISRPVPTSL